MEKLAYLFFLTLLVLGLSECSNTTKDSDDTILSVNKQVWDSIGWKDSTFLGVKMPLYKMVECGRPIAYNELHQMYQSEDSSVWIIKNTHDIPNEALGVFSWDWWFGRESILTRLNSYPITIKKVSWHIDSRRSIFMYYKCVDNDSLVPIDGFIFKWREMPDFYEDDFCED